MVEDNDMFAGDNAPVQEDVEDAAEGAAPEGEGNDSAGQTVAEPVAQAPKTRKRAKPKAKAKRTRRSVHSILREVFPNAPADLLSMIEARVGTSTLAELGELNEGTVDDGIRATCYRYANKIISDRDVMTKTFAKQLQEDAERVNMNYESYFSARGAGGLSDAVHRVAGGGSYSDILARLG